MEGIEPSETSCFVFVFRIFGLSTRIKDHKVAQGNIGWLTPVTSLFSTGLQSTFLSLRTQTHTIMGRAEIFFKGSQRATQGSKLLNFMAATVLNFPEDQLMAELRLFLQTHDFLQTKFKPKIKERYARRPLASS